MEYELNGKKYKQCINFSYEITDFNECENDPNLCNKENMQCLNKNGSYECICSDGYKISNECAANDNECIKNQKCEDINEV